MIYCPGCSTANRAGSRFCNHCGARLSEEGVLVCSRCGANNLAEVPHCQECGAALATRPRPEEAADAGAAPEARATGEPPPPPALPEEDPGKAAPPARRDGSLGRVAPPARRGGGLPPWLDDVEDGSKTASLEDLEEDRIEGPALRGEWSADAIPIEPAVGVPYRAHEQAELPLTPEQESAAALFAATAAEEVHDAPQEMPGPHRPQGLAASLRWLIAAALLLAVVVPMIWSLGPLGVVAAVPGPVAAAAKTIDELPPGALVLVAFEYDAGLAGDLQPVAEAYLRHLFSRQARVLVVSTQPEGAALADMALDRVLPAYPGVRYGESILHLGYAAGGEAAVRALGLNLAAIVPTDYRRQEPLERFPIVEGVAGLRGLPLVVVLGHDPLAVRRWIEQVGTPHGVPLVAGVPAMVEPALEPYRASGQLRGLVAGVGGAAAYEHLGAGPGTAGRMLASLRVGIWVTAGLVVLANLSRLLGFLRPRRGV